MTNHLLLLDASGYIHKAFHAGAHQYRDDGLPIWAIMGFMAMTWSMLKRASGDTPTHAAAVFDAPGQNFRHTMFSDYKGNRPPARRLELIPQLPYIRNAALALGMTPVEKSGFEADDVLATYATQAAAKGWRTTIVSADKDLLQLVRDGVIEVVEPTNRKRFLAAQVRAKFGVLPDLVPDAQALSGDDVDNIPGIDGIGVKLAGSLIHKFGGLEPLLAACGRSGMAIGTPRIRKNLRQGADNARLYKKLATLDQRVKGLPDLETLALHPPEMDHLKEMLRVLGQLRRFDDMFGGNPETTIRLPHVPASLVWWHGAPKPRFPKDGMGDPEPPALKEIPNDPQDGYFKTRMVRGGGWVPARIWREEEKDFITGQLTGFDVVKCEVNGKPRNPLREWVQLARFPITKGDFDYRVAAGGWAKQHDPNSSEANPHKVIDWNKEPI